MATSNLHFFFGVGKISVSNELVEATSLLAGNHGMAFTVFDANSTNALRSVSLRNDRSSQQIKWNCFAGVCFFTGNIQLVEKESVSQRLDDGVPKILTWWRYCPPSAVDYHTLERHGFQLLNYRPVIVGRTKPDASRLDIFKFEYSSNFFQQCFNPGRN